jgi:hypothetical protein
MRVSDILKRHKISFSTLIEVFEIMNINYQISLNTKLNENDQKFIERIITDNKFDRYCLSRQLFSSSKKMLSKLFLSEIENIHCLSEISNFEAQRIFDSMKSDTYVRRIYVKTHKITFKKYNDIILSDKYFEQFLKLFKQGKKLSEKEYDYQMENLIIDFDEILKKYNDYSADTLSEIKLQNNEIDHEEIIMQSLRRGDADFHGF